MRTPASCLTAIFCLLAALTSSASAAESRPNVLFLFSDDQRADTIAALGNPHIKTPNLDQICRSGFIFRNAYCFGGNEPAVCRPSRTMLMNGRTYFRWQGDGSAAKGATFPGALKAAGYQTYHHGKSGNVPKQINEQFEINRYVENDERARRSGEPGKEIVDSAIEFLQQRDDHRPLFMFLAFAVPHDPRVAAAKYMAMYDRDQIPLPKNYRPVHPFDNGEMTIRDEQLAAWPRTESEIRQHLHDYYATITAFDGHIGRLLDTMKQLGIYDNTIIIFSSDHGLAMGSHGLMGKQNLYEDGMKAPLFFSGPGIPQGESQALVYLHDIFPTVCELAGTEVPSEIDGRGLASIIRGKAKQVRSTLFTAYRQVQRAVRDERWKLIRYPHINRSQLFDLENDPHELNDLADSPEHRSQVDKLMGVMAEWQKELGDTVALTSADPQDPTFTPPPPDPLWQARPLTKAGEFTKGIEGPATDADGNIYAVNFERQGTIGRVTPAGKGEVFVTLPGDSVGNGIRFDRRGSMFIADYVNHNVLRVDMQTREIHIHAHDDQMNQPNDLAIAPDGTLYASDPNWKDGSGQLWRISRDGKVKRIASGMGSTNGIEVSPDGKKLYVNESVQRNVWEFSITPEGELSDKRLVKQFPDHGFDGMRCDVDGNLYITRYGKGTVVKLSPSGEILKEVDVLGKAPSNLCFGGRDGRTVYVTEVEHTRLVEFRVDRPGLEWRRWQNAQAEKAKGKGKNK